MKTKLLTICFLLMGVSAGAQQKITVYQDCARNGAPDNQTGQAPANVEMVDLGLSVKWANMNVGATAPEEYGDYFAWGETQGYTGDTNDGHSFDWASYKYCNGSEYSMTKYCTDSYYGNNGFTDGKTTLDPEDDAAHVNWGAEWRMPTDAEWEELLTNCTWTWTQVNGKNGYVVTASNGNSIFLPAAGYRRYSLLDYAGSYGQYWSASLDSGNSNDAYHVTFYSGNVCRVDNFRLFGLSVRPVRPSTTPAPTTHTITFVNYDGTTLQSDNVEEGSIPSYRGITPTKPANTEYSYEFAGWSPSVVAATESATYTATFTATPTTSGSAPVLSSAGRTSCEYVQLWENGPKWATFNVGATITDYANLTVGADAMPYSNFEEQSPYYNTANVGGLYAWYQPNYNGRQTTWTSSVSTGVADVATTLWGSNWKTPTRQQLDTLQKSSYGKTVWTWCDGSSTQYVPGCVLKGYKVSGVGAYAEKSIFLPAAGYFNNRNGTVDNASGNGEYWSGARCDSYNAYYLYFSSGSRAMGISGCEFGLSVRAVLVE